MNREQLLAWGQKTLKHHVQQAAQDAMTLLRTVLKGTSTQLLAYSEKPVSKIQEYQFRALIQRRCQGEPIAYLTGQCEFWSLPLIVSPDCLIPRPDTELLVDLILGHYPSDEEIRLVDLGTGSGAIAIALALERAYWKIIATDQSTTALQIAQNNAKRLGVQIEFRQGDWFQALSPAESFHAIISNPPYLGQQDPYLSGLLRYEPQLAFVGGEQGTETLHYLIQQASDYLIPRGSLWVEQGFNQASIIQSYFQEYGYTNIHQYQDYGGITRVSSGCRPSSGYVAK